MIVSFARFFVGRFLPLLAAFSLLVNLIPAQLAFAATNKFYITPSNTTINAGAPLSISVGSFSSTDTPDSPGYVDGQLQFTTGTLQVSSISTGGSAYGSPTVTPGNGTIHFSGSRSSSPSGQALIFSVTFQTIAAGSATISFSGDSTLNNTATSGNTVGTYTITGSSAPSPSPSTSSTPSSGSSSSSSGPKNTPQSSPIPIVTTPVTTTDNTNDTSNTTTPDPTGVIQSVTIEPTYTSATVTWKVNATNPTSSINYGTNSSQIDKQSGVQDKGGGTFSSTISGLDPGQKYYFLITGSGTGTASATYSGSILTSGFPVVISVTENKVVANNAQVQIGASNYTTQADGKVTIGLAAGNYSGKITTDTATLAINLTIGTKTIPADGSPPEAQTFVFNLTSSPLDNGPGSGSAILTFVGVLTGGAVILVFGFLIFINYRRHKFDSATDAYSTMSTGPTVVVEDGYNWQHDTPAPPQEQIPAAGASQLPGDLPHHANSVYLSEEEPLDMFEKDKLEHQSSTPKPQPSTVQTPSSPHSTTP